MKKDNKYYIDYAHLKKVIEKYNRLGRYASDRIRGGSMEAMFAITELYRELLLGNISEYDSISGKKAILLTPSQIGQRIGYDQKSVQYQMYKIRDSRIFEIENVVNVPYYNFYKIVVPISFYYECDNIRRHHDGSVVEKGY